MSVANIGISCSQRSQKSILKGFPGEPDWHVVPSKGMTNLSDEKLTMSINALAKNEADATDSKDLEKLNYEKEHLRAQFVSSVSPDRKALLQSANRMIKKEKSQRELPAGEIDLIYFLNKYDGIIDDGQKLPSVSLSEIHNSSGFSDYEISWNGNAVLKSINGKWGYGMTPDELKRSQQFNGVFENAYNAEKDNISKEFSVHA